VDKVMAVREDSLPEAPAAEAATAPSPPPSRSAG
jgi:hypothetical protein